MLELGKRQSLTVVKTVDFGVYLSEGEGAGGRKCSFRKKEVPEGTKTGDQLEVFLYKDSKGPSHRHQRGTGYPAGRGCPSESSRERKNRRIS